MPDDALVKEPHRLLGRDVCDVPQAISRTATRDLCVWATAARADRSLRQVCYFPSIVPRSVSVKRDEAPNSGAYRTRSFEM